MQSFLLQSGATLLYEQTDRFKGESFGLQFTAPISKDIVTSSALMCEVLLRGSQSYPTQQLLSRRCDELYSLALSAGTRRYGRMHSVGFALSMLGNSYSIDGTDIAAQSIRLLSDIAQRPYLEGDCFKPEYVSLEKRNLRDTLRAQKNAKSSYALRRAMELMCDGSAYGVSHSGYEADIDSITDKQLILTHKESVLDTLPVVYYVGARSKDDVERYIGDSFNFGTKKQELLGYAPRQIKPYCEYSEQMDVAQTTVVLGFRLPKTLFDTDYVKIALFNEILGGSPTSKLFLNVREKQSLCYYCSSVVKALDGNLYIVSGVNPKNKDALTNAALEQINEIKKGNITDAEFDFAVSSLICGYTKTTDSSAMLAEWYLNRYYAGRNDSPLDAAKALKGVTKDDIIAIANGLIPECRYVLEG